MSVWPETHDGPTCGLVGCRQPAAVRVDHNDQGEIVVCSDHADGHEVVSFV